MRHLTARQKSVRKYFDTIANGYRERYNASKPFHRYFFETRLRLATDGLELNGKRILDIGAGTGALYDFLLTKGIEFDYTATDISAQMLEQSNIPIANRHVGDLSSINFSKSHFDYIFLLGVTSYCNGDELYDLLQNAKKLLSPHGKLIVSFTNPQSLDSKLIRIIRPHLKSLNKKLVGQSFKTYGYTPQEVSKIISPLKVQYYNCTLFPFNQLLPRLSVNLSKAVFPFVKNNVLRKYFCTDYVISN